VCGKENAWLYEGECVGVGNNLGGKVQFHGGWELGGACEESVVCASELRAKAKIVWTLCEEPSGCTQKEDYSDKEGLTREERRQITVQAQTEQKAKLEQKARQKYAPIEQQLI